MSERTCTVEGCTRKHAAKGLCRVHYKRRSKTGTLDRYGVAVDPNDGTDLKMCRRCSQVKPRAEYSPNSLAADGCKGRCRNCENEILREKWAANHNGIRQKALARQRRYAYGATPERISDFLKAQDYGCGICRQPIGATQTDFHIDHDHKTGLMRGLLCHKCNRGLGLFGDDEDGLLAALIYLSKPPCGLDMARREVAGNG